MAVVTRCCIVILSLTTTLRYTSWWTTLLTGGVLLDGNKRALVGKSGHRGRRGSGKRGRLLDGG